MISGLFGPTPEEIQQAQYQQSAQNAATMAGMNATQRGVMGMMQGGAGLVNTFAPMLGMENRAVEQARGRQQAMSESNIDLNDPASLRTAALRLKQVDPQMAMRLGILANQREAEVRKAEIADRKQMLTEKKEDFRQTQEFALRQQQALGQLQIQYDNLQERIRANKEREGDRDAERALRLQIAEMQKSLGASQRKLEVQTADDRRMLRDMDAMSGELAEKAKAIAEHPGLPGATGALGALYSIPGGDAAKAEQLIDEFKSMVKRIGFERIRSTGSIGQITEKEWKIIEDMVTAIDPVKLGPDGVKAQLDKALKMYATTLQNAKIRYLELYGDEFNPEEIKRPGQEQGQGAGQQPAAYDAAKEARYQEWLKSQGGR